MVRVGYPARNPRKRIQERRNLFGWSKKERTAKAKRHSAGSTEARSAGYRFATHKTDENLREWMDRKDFGDEKQAVKERLAAAFNQGYMRGKNEEDRKEAIAKADADRKIKGFDRKIESAEKKIDTAKGKASGGKMSEAQFESVKAKLQREIDRYEEGKRAAAARSLNPQLPHISRGTDGLYYLMIPAGQNILKEWTWKRSGKGHATRAQAVKANASTMAAVLAEMKKSNPAVSAAQYRLAQAVLAGTAREQRMTKKAAQEIVSKTPAKLRSQFMRVKSRTARLQGRASSAEKFHGVPADKVRKVVEYRKPDGKMTELGDMVRLVIDTPTGKVVALNFAESGKGVVRLATRPVKNKAGKIIGKQLYFVGGDQEPDLKAFGMSGEQWVRDRMELGRLHHFPKSAKEGSIVYRTKKQFHNMKLTDYWHRPGEETVEKVGPAALPIVIYDHRNKKLDLAGGNYRIDSPRNY